MSYDYHLNEINEIYQSNYETPIETFKYAIQQPKLFNSLVDYIIKIYELSKNKIIKFALDLKSPQLVLYTIKKSKNYFITNEDDENNVAFMFGNEKIANNPTSIFIAIDINSELIMTELVNNYIINNFTQLNYFKAISKAIDISHLNVLPPLLGKLVEFYRSKKNIQFIESLIDDWVIKSFRNDDSSMYYIIDFIHHLKINNSGTMIRLYNLARSDEYLNIGGYRYTSVFKYLIKTNNSINDYQYAKKTLDNLIVLLSIPENRSTDTSNITRLLFKVLGDYRLDIQNKNFNLLELAVRYKHINIIKILMDDPRAAPNNLIIEFSRKFPEINSLINGYGNPGWTFLRIESQKDEDIHKFLGSKNYESIYIDRLEVIDILNKRQLLQFSDNTSADDQAFRKYYIMTDNDLYQKLNEKMVKYYMYFSHISAALLLSYLESESQKKDDGLIRFPGALGNPKGYIFDSLLRTVPLFIQENLKYDYQRDLPK